MILALIILAALVVFGRAITGEFLFDDAAIYDMTDPADPNAPYSERKAGGGHGGIWRRPSFFRTPRGLTNLTYYWTWKAFRFWPPGWHAFNLAAHSVNIALSYRLARFILPGRTALIVAAIFALHPHQAASVCYISGRAAILATLFTMCSFILLLEGGLLCQSLAVLSAYLAAKSKQDAPLYFLLFPVLWLYSR